MVRRYSHNAKTKTQSNSNNNKRSQHQYQHSQHAHNNQTTSPIVWMILLAGLSFCLINVTYIFCATHLQSIPSFASRHEQEQHSHNNKSITGAENVGADKERIVQILKDAGVEHAITPEILANLPTWQDVVDKLGPEPRIYGLDSCQTFRTSLPHPSDGLIAPAGAFNSGTNLMAELLIANCYNPARRKEYGSDGVRWQVNWGKHQPPKFRVDQAVYKNLADASENEHMLPVVTVRDPYTWMQSLCRNRYATHWFHEVNFHCPNLIPNHVEREFLPQALDGSYKRNRIDLHHKDPWLMDNIMNTANYTLQHKTVPVYVKYNRETINHDSLAHMWNEWYHDYYRANMTTTLTTTTTNTANQNATTFPRVMVRYEDLLFYGKEVTTAACTCFGGQMKRRFRHIGGSAKVGVIHLNKTSLIDNMIKFGKATDADKVKGMTPEDIAFAKEVLAKDMMESFAYRHPNLP